MTSNTILLKKTRANFIETVKKATVSESALTAETLVGGLEIIEKISAEWIELCEEGASNEPFFRPEWFRALVKNFENEILLVTVRKNGKLKAVLPLAKKKDSLHGVPVVKLGAIFNLQSQRFDLVHTADESEKDEILKAIWCEIKRQKGWNVFETRLTYKTSWLSDLLKIAESENYKTGVWEMDSAPFVSLPEGENKSVLIENYFKGLSKNRRKLLSKNLRHLQEIGKVEFCVTHGFSKELVEKYFALEAQSWKARAGTDVNSDEKIKNLHEDFARECAVQNVLFIHELKLDGKTIAMYLSIGFDAKRTIGWKMSFDENYARFSPGNVLFKEVLSECMRRNSTELDMLSPSNYNKKLFASGEREHCAFYIFQKGIYGSFLNFWKFEIVQRLRKFKEKKESKSEK
ncbi:MAG TPA: GNAT family N-acetyltransferase [Pyrinomonadaceae bacterium]|nr:GNAT family N-acetyltransferase [Pyrinomonadaceae bacterium]